MNIRPTPTDEEAAAIAAAIEVSWPRAVVAAEVAEPPRWRFADRWWTKPIPVRRDRPLVGLGRRPRRHVASRT